jgi:L-ascorbate metabolism protein UlaG (beta-lactamase superfamily)
MINLTYYGHSCFEIQTGPTRIIIDPFLTGNPLASIKASDVRADFVLVTHAHGDHLGDAVDIAKATGATVVSNNEIAVYCEGKGAKTRPMHIGGSAEFPFGRVKLTIAHHGSAFPDSSYGGNPCGFIVTTSNKKIYHAGDTGLFYDMKLIGEEGIDVALLPIGDNFTMGADDALRAVKLLKPRVVIPMHYNTMDIIKEDPHSFRARVENETESKCVVLRPGDSYQVSE